MRRPALPIVLLSLLAVSIAAPPTVASASAASDEHLATLDARIETAHARVERWYERIQRWYGRIERASARVERLEDLLERSDAWPRDDVLRRGSPRWADPSFLLVRASRDLRATLKDPWARKVQAELDTWSAYLAELTRARERASRPSQEDRPSGSSRDAASRGPLTYEGWASAFLGRLGAPACAENLLIVVTWETAESTSARYNPLATTRDMPGATDLNDVGVKHYVSLDQGLDASRDTLLLGADSYGYRAIVAGLRACEPADSTADAINASAWCRGCVGGAYVTGLVPIVRASYDEHAVRPVAAAA
jgi:hypothetical protein